MSTYDYLQLAEEYDPLKPLYVLPTIRTVT